ncbi:MAG: DNA alkylation repair protein [Myxococcales bacterium]|nr:DNA alkylation repair protein [Myxococcales bacterium]
MAEPFKNLLNADCVKDIARDFTRVWPEFPSKKFIATASTGLEALELKDRSRHIAKALGATLPQDVDRAMELAIASLTVTEGSSAFRFMPLSTWLHDVGPTAIEPALRLNRELTKRFTAEFSIRSLITHARARTLKELKVWAKDENAHVRRLVSEGTRPRLPWAERLPELQADPSLALPLLELLKDDESEYVRRSVANHLNDIAKDHPTVVLATARRWLVKATPERRRLVEHGLRTLVKAGNEDALSLLGASGEGLKVSGTVTPAKLTVGSHITVEATVKNGSDALTHVVVEAVVHFKRPKGSSTKKFRLARLDLPAGAKQTVTRRFQMAHRSIRRLHAGEHRVDVQANGRTAKAGSFDLKLT